MLGKIIDGKLTYPPHRIVLDGMQIFNPTETQLMAAGYKTITETTFPEDHSPDGQHYEAQYADSGDTITQSWILFDDVPVETGKTLDERVTALEQNQADMDAIFKEVVNNAG